MTKAIELFQHDSMEASGRAELIVDASVRSPHAVHPWLYGKFCEHLGFNIYHGMEAQILFNCTFGRWRFSAGDNHPDGGVCEEGHRESIVQRIEGGAQRMGWPDAIPIRESYFEGGAYGWFHIGGREDVRLSPDADPHGGRAQRVEIMHAAGTMPYGIGQWMHLPLHRTRGFEFRVVARAAEPTTVTLSIAPTDQNRDGIHCEIQLGTDWQTSTGDIHLPGDWPPDALFLFAITTDQPAHFVLDRVLLYPDDHVNSSDPDVIRLLKDSKLPLLRWPGGNFVSGYHWRDGVGPVDARPTLPNPAWSGLEFNLFGTDEFMTFCEAVGCEPLICVNAGDGTAEEAAAWVEYCNGSTDTPMGRLRAENGHPEPYNVRYWEIGNEIYGRWQVTWTTPEGNVDRYRRFREAMIQVDPSIQLIGCGYGNEPNSEWNDHLIDHAGETLRCITDHILTGGSVDADTDPVELYHAFMGYPTVLEQRYGVLWERMMAAGIEDPRLAITELQLFAHFRGEVRADGKLSPATLPSQDSITEALYHAAIVHTCIRLGDFVELLTHSATVNHGGGLRKNRERVYANPVHYSHALGNALAGGTPVAVRLACETFSTHRAFAHIPPMEDVPVLDAMAVISPAGELVLMLIHRGAVCGAIELAVDIEGFQARGTAELTTLAGEAWYSRNTLDMPEKITPQHSHVGISGDNQLKLTLPPFSLTCAVIRSLSSPCER